MKTKLWIIVGSIIIAVIAIVVVGIITAGPGATRNLSTPLGVVNNAPPTHGVLGIELVPSSSPLTILNAIEGTGASNAGIQPGDVLLTVNGVDVADAKQVRDCCTTTRPGDMAALRIRRGQREMILNVRLISFAEMVANKSRARERQQRQNATHPSTN